VFLLSTTPPNGAEWDRHGERYGRCARCRRTILLLSFLYSAYQAFASGGDVPDAGDFGIKYLILGLVFANYGTVFRDVNGMFNSVANFIYNSTGVGISSRIG